ncbi:MAG: MTAP family purine nucleoside phosphorylase [Sandaracinaceae bacterium]|nr:MTAP family purine nucleoside phosphorylase [Sandaracinaceae bacterium]
MRTLGVIGGSGLYAMEGLEDVSEHAVDTAFGAPSDVVVSGRIGDTFLLFLPRHGRGHRFAPHGINYRANILALKQLGAEQIVSFSAVGSMKENIRPGDVVMVDQFIDRTRTRPSTFFEGVGLVAHVELADPVDAALSAALYRAAVAVGARAHRGGTYVCIEGPQFSTRAESNLYRSWGVDGSA